MLEYLLLPYSTASSVLEISHSAYSQFVCAIKYQIRTHLFTHPTVSSALPEQSLQRVHKL